MTRLLGLIYARKQDEQVNKAVSHCLRAVVPRLVTWSDICDSFRLETDRIALHFEK